MNLARSFLFLYTHCKHNGDELVEFREVDDEKKKLD